MGIRTYTRKKKSSMKCLHAVILSIALNRDRTSSKVSKPVMPQGIKQLRMA